jgi:phosphoglycerate dehydrogenase-like enzyme
MKKLVLDMMDRRPMWAMPSWVIDEIASAIPGDWELVVLDEAADGTGDGYARATPAVLEAVEGAEVYCGFGIPAELLERGSDLKWVHSGSAGVGSSLTPQMMASDVIFTNSKGVHGPPMAETVLGMILYFARGLDFAAAGMREGRWTTDAYYSPESPVREVSTCTVGVLGFGGIGQGIAARVAPLGARVLGYRRGGLGRWETWIEPAAPARIPEAPKNLHAQEEPGYSVTNLSGPEGFEELLRESDYLIVCAPSTPQTDGIINAESIERMKDGAVLINVSRGSLVDEEALVDALRSGKLRGAGLDVVSREPLPEDSPLWGFGNVLITPHVSAVTTEYWTRQTQLIVWNLRRLAEGEDLLNVVDRLSGY